MSKFNEIDWEQPWSPLYGKAITIPENTIIWRSYDKSYPAVDNRFGYYSSKEIAQEYTRNNSRELGHFVLKRPLKLLDYRFMKVLLSRLIHTNQSDKTIQYLAAIVLSFGLCSFSHQIYLLKNRYKDLDKTTKEYKQINESIKTMELYLKPNLLIEQIGVRIAETTNDAFTMGFLQELFKGVFDGFISPRLFSPFHIEKDNYLMSPEIIIFNPKESKIELMPKYPTTTYIKQLRIDDLIRSNAGHVLIENVKKNKLNMDINLEFFICGGGLHRHYLDTIDDALNTQDKEMEQIYMNGKKIGHKWRKKLDISFIEPPVLYIPVSPFSIGI
jgi:hypothetical protein